MLLNAYISREGSWVGQPGFIREPPSNGQWLRLAQTENAVTVQREFLSDYRLAVNSVSLFRAYPMPVHVSVLFRGRQFITSIFGIASVLESFRLVEVVEGEVQQDAGALYRVELTIQVCSSDLPTVHGSSERLRCTESARTNQGSLGGEPGPLVLSW